MGRAWKRGRMVENFRTEKPWKVRPVDVLGWFWHVKPKGEVKILPRSQGSWPPSLIRSRLQPHLDRNKTRTRSKLGRNSNYTTSWKWATLKQFDIWQNQKILSETHHKQEDEASQPKNWSEQVPSCPTWPSPGHLGNEKGVCSSISIRIELKIK